MATLKLHLEVAPHFLVYFGEIQNQVLATTAFIVCAGVPLANLFNL